MAVRMSASRTGRPLTPGRVLVLISARGRVDPMAIVRLERLGQYIRTHNWLEDITPCSAVEVRRRFGVHTTVSGRPVFVRNVGILVNTFFRKVGKLIPRAVGSSETFLNLSQQHVPPNRRRKPTISTFLRNVSTLPPSTTLIWNVGERQPLYTESHPRSGLLTTDITITSLCLGPDFTLVSCSTYYSTLKMEAICSSETSFDSQRTTQRYIPEDGTLLTRFFFQHISGIHTLKVCSSVKLPTQGVR
jgi:hypothetical protein